MALLALADMLILILSILCWDICTYCRSLLPIPSKGVQMSCHDIVLRRHLMSWSHAMTSGVSGFVQSCQNTTAACQKLDLDLWPSSMTLTPTCDLDPTFDLDIWATTLTYNSNLAKVKVILHTKYQGRTSNGSAMRGGTDGQIDRQMDSTKCIISLICDTYWPIINYSGSVLILTTL